MAEALARGWANLIGRLDGPLHFRFLVQPGVAVFLAVRAGLRDAREGQPPFLSALFLSPIGRSERLRQAWRDVGAVFVVSAVLDAVYQIRVHASVFALELLITATFLALVPYALVRGPTTRLARRARAQSHPRSKESQDGNHASGGRDTQVD
jgi:hypothetical protein